MGSAQNWTAMDTTTPKPTAMAVAYQRVREARRSFPAPMFWADKAETAETALKDYVQSQIDANTDYRPAEIPKLESALVDRRGETLLLVVASDLDAAKGAVGLK